MTLRKTSLASFSLSAIALCVCTHVNAQERQTAGVEPSQMVQGGTGLIQTPTSRMAEPGNFAMNYTDNEEYRFFSVSLQLFPWMEATARYTDVRTKLYSQSVDFSGNQTLKDKGLDVKFRLWEESFYIPEISVGFRDFGGTGFFDSEYVTASKAVGPLDFHLGVGWGYLGTSDDITNPFCKLKESYCDRETGYSGKGGKIDYQKFFKGPVAFFGGMEYQTPWEPLTLKLEYEGNNYKADRAGELKQDSRWNIGAVYRWQGFDFSLNYQRGNTVGFGVTYKFNMNTASQYKIKPDEKSLMARQVPDSIDGVNKSRLYNTLSGEGGFLLADAELSEDKAVFYGVRNTYRDPDEATQRAGRIIASELPDTVKTYHLVEQLGPNSLVDTQIDAEKFIAAARYEGIDNDIRDTYHREAPSDDIRANYDPQGTSGFYGSTDFFFVQTFGNPEDFYLFQTGLIFSGGYAFNQNVAFSGSLRTTLLTNFDKFKFTVDNEDVALPRVRTYTREYAKHDVWLDTAFMHWSDQLSENVFAQAYGGYLETMFGGVGGELLYRPVDSEWTFGVDVNYVKQRDFDNNVKFMDYTAVTGHLSAYWEPKFLPDTRLTLGVGQFLAKDKGVNIDFAKRFDSGIIIGAYAAITNVSAEEYGEGSFTKGFYISIPMDLLLLQPSIGRGQFPWVPIARDGGQVLKRPIRLIDTTEDRSNFY